MTVNSSLSNIEKERILRALEEDREFRYALMGLLGFKEILERFAKLEERQQRLEEGQQRLEERFTQLEERFARIEEKYQELEERFTKLEERFAELEKRFARIEEKYQELEEKFAKLEERFARLEERFTRLEERYQELEKRFAGIEERQQRLEERQQKLEERLVEVLSELASLRKTVNAVAHRFGLITEGSFREALKGILSKYFGATASRLIVNDEEGVVYGYPSIVEIDVVVKDKEHILVETKSRADPGDVLELVRKGLLYEKVKGVKPRLVMVAAWAPAKTREVAGKHNVEIYTYVEE